MAVEMSSLVLTLGRDVEPVGRRRAGAERQEGGRTGARRRLRRLVVEAAVDEAVGAEHELVALVELATAHDALEAADVVDLSDGAHHELVGRDQLQAARAAHPEQPVASTQQKPAY